MSGKLISEKIKQRRTEIDFTQQDLANEAGLNVSIIKAIETGRSETSYENVVKIAEALGVEVSSIYLEDFRDTKVITIANNKGGSGKSTAVSNLSYSLTEINKGVKILQIDSDMQMNLSYSYGIERDVEKNLNVALIKEESLENYIKKTSYNNIDIVISDFDMATIEMTLFTKTLRESVFKRILQPVVEKGLYDYIILDTNPTLGMLNFNILNASDYVFIPVEMSAFGILGLEVVTKFIKQVQNINTNLQLGGVLRTKVDKRENVTKDADELLKDVFGDKILNTYISVDTNVKKAQWNSIPLNIYNQGSRATEQYRELAKEVIKIVRK